MTGVRNKKKSYVGIILTVIVISVFFGFIFDFACTQIEYLIYPMPDEYSSYVEKYSHDYDVPKELIYAVIKTESGFRADAVSNKGAVGLMQIMPYTFEWITDDLLHEYHEVGMLYDPETNIKYGTYYLHRLYNKFGDWNTAIAAYNGGEGNVSEWLADSKYSDDGIKLNIDNIPQEFEETENYVKKVNKAVLKYKELYD